MNFWCGMLLDNCDRYIRELHHIQKCSKHFSAKKQSFLMSNAPLFKYFKSIDVFL